MKLPNLSNREKDILRAYIRCGTHAAIAQELGLRRQTIKNYASTILAAFNVQTLGQAAMIFDRIDRESWPTVERRQGERRKA